MDEWTNGRIDRWKLADSSIHPFVNPSIPFSLARISETDPQAGMDDVGVREIPKNSAAVTEKRRAAHLPVQPFAQIRAPDRPGERGPVRRVPQPEQPKGAHATRKIARDTGDERQLIVMRVPAEQRVFG